MSSMRSNPTPSDDQRALEKAIAALTPAQRQLLLARQGRRRRSEREFLGLPLYDYAVGPDPAKGETRGHAKGVIAIGDIATGVFAFGGWARGVFAFGGLATGIVSFGGLSAGLAAAFGGAALSFGLAIGGGALGSIAVGGGAVGHYAAGGAAYGTYVADAQRLDHEVIDLFEQFGLTPPAADVRRRAPAR
jgi:hypothetical protein